MVFLINKFPSTDTTISTDITVQKLLIAFITWPMVLAASGQNDNMLL